MWAKLPLFENFIDSHEIYGGYRRTEINFDFGHFIVYTFGGVKYFLIWRQTDRQKKMHMSCNVNALTIHDQATSWSIIFMLVKC